MTPNESVDILVIEDIERSRTSAVMALEDSVPLISIAAVTDGREAHDFLLGRGQAPARNGGELPRLILLDLGMPGDESFSMLGQIEFVDIQSGLDLLPLTLFGDSPQPEGTSKTFHCGVGGYTLYPLSCSDVPAIVESVSLHWKRLNTTPAE